MRLGNVYIVYVCLFRFILVLPFFCFGRTFMHIAHFVIELCFSSIALKMEWIIILLFYLFDWATVSSMNGIRQRGLWNWSFSFTIFFFFSIDCVSILMTDTNEAFLNVCHSPFGWSTRIFDFIEQFEWLLLSLSGQILDFGTLSGYVDTTKDKYEYQMPFFTYTSFFGSKWRERPSIENLIQTKTNIMYVTTIAQNHFYSTIFVMCKQHTTISFPFKCVSNDRSDDEWRNKRKQHF